MEAEGRRGNPSPNAGGYGIPCEAQIPLCRLRGMGLSLAPGLRLGDSNTEGKPNCYKSM